MKSITLESPAKINLMLSVHGPRGDGFHALTSVVVALKFCDSLQVSIAQVDADRLECEDLRVPTGETNLILQAAAAFRAALGESIYFNFKLVKRIPMGAGLGGGSSNAVAALRAMQQLTGERLDAASLMTIAASLGSDCPFFIEAVPAVLSGRGELVTALSAVVADSLRGQRIVLFQPDFGIPTKWAYQRLIESAPTAYESQTQALERLRTYQATEIVPPLLYNSFEASVGSKYLAIPCLLETLRAAGLACQMSGSGSCCFALSSSEEESAQIRELCQKAWGSSAFYVETSIG